MVGVSEDLPFASFLGEECSMIGLGQFQLQFHFSGGSKSITTESRWELRDAAGEIVDQVMPCDERLQYRLHLILGQLVRGFAVNAPLSFTLQFENGYTLTIYDDEERYECFSIHTERSFLLHLKPSNRLMQMPRPSNCFSGQAPLDALNKPKSASLPAVAGALNLTVKLFTIPA